MTNTTSLPGQFENREVLDTQSGSQVTVTAVLDTSVLVADPGILDALEGLDVVIPLTAIEELDGLKTRLDDVGRSARAAVRRIEELRMDNGGTLAVPVQVGSCTVRIEVNGIRRDLVAAHGLSDTPDNRIIGAALGQAQHGRTMLLSNDTALRIKAAHLGLEAYQHVPTRSSNARVAAGWSVLEVGSSHVDDVYRHGSVDADQVGVEDGSPNTFFVLKCGSQSALTRFNAGRLEALRSTSPEAWGLNPRNKEQRFALELLSDPNVQIVALDGSAGTGKSLLAIAAGLEQVVEQRRFESVSVYRPIIPVGRADVGFLPGGLEEKLDPWMAAVADAVAAVTSTKSNSDARRMMDELTARGQLKMESVTFLRGRSLSGQYVIVDEAQNLEPSTLKTILTRVGEGSKIVFTGDTSQIDAPYLGPDNNALAVLIGAFSGQHMFGHLTLTMCERSKVASLAAELL